jgi:hypothetical protein
MLAVAVSTYSRQEQGLEKLPEPTTGDVGEVENFTMGDEHFSDGIDATYSERWAVYKLDDHRTFSGKAGIRDGYSGDGRVRVKLDGAMAKELKVSPNKKPIQISIDLRDKQSLRIELDNCTIGTPRLTKAPPPPAPLTPDDKTYKPGPIRFEWRDYPGATTYAVQIVSTGLENDAVSGAPRIWCYTVEGTEFTVDASGFPPGVYRWSVLAFDARRTLTSFNESKRFTIRK